MVITVNVILILIVKIKTILTQPFVILMVKNPCKILYLRQEVGGRAVKYARNIPISTRSKVTISLM